jgi:hypothetical protein
LRLAVAWWGQRHRQAEHGRAVAQRERERAVRRPSLEERLHTHVRARAEGGHAVQRQLRARGHLVVVEEMVVGVQAVEGGGERVVEAVLIRREPQKSSVCRSHAEPEHEATETELPQHA